MESVTTRSGRTVKVTDKVKQLLQEKQDSQAAKSRAKLAKELKKLAESEKEADDLYEGFKKLEAEKLAFEQLQLSEIQDLTRTEVSQYEDYYDAELTVIHQSTHLIRDKLNGKPHETQATMQGQDTRDEHPQETPQENASMAAVAELEAQRQVLLKQQEIEEERFRLDRLRRELEHKEQLLKLEAELTLQQAKAGIVPVMSGGQERNQAESHNPSVADPSHHPPVGMTSSTPNRAPRTTSANSNVSDMEGRLEGAFSRLADAMETAVSQPHNLVKIEPTVFTGKVLEFAGWLATFEDLIQEVGPERRMTYLLKYVKEDALAAVEYLGRVEPVHAYKEAMSILKERYNNNFTVYEAFREKLDDWPTIREGDGVSLRRYADFLGACLTAKDHVSYLRILDDYTENIKLARKLSRRMQDKWSGKVDDWMEKHGSDTQEFPPFKVFVEFMKKQARIECGPVKSSLSRSEPRGARPSRVNITETSENETDFEENPPPATVNYAAARPRPTNNAPEKVACPCCKGTHGVTSCSKFLKMTPKERHYWSRKEQVCKGCLKSGHYVSRCTEPTSCKTCSKPHHTLFHDEEYRNYLKTRNREKRNAEKSNPDTKEKTSDSKIESASTNSVAANLEEAALILPVYIRQGKNSTAAVPVYAILDGQSDTCFMSHSLKKRLGVEHTPTYLDLKTMTGRSTVKVDRVNDLFIRSFNMQEDVALPKTYAHDIINADHAQIADPSQVARWEHLAEVAQKIYPVMKEVEIGILIGRNCVKALKPRECIPGGDDDPYAVRTKMGWGVVGDLNPVSARRDQNSRRTAMVNITVCRETPMDKVNRMFNMEYSEADSNLKLSQDDKKFMDQLERGMKVTREGKIELPLPMKDEDPMPSNCRQALALLLKLKPQFERNPELHEQYTAQMEDIVENHAEEAPEDYEEGKAWWLPHHITYHPQTGKPRCVFNCSICHRGHCLNKKLLTGPDMINNLVGVLCRFRKPKKVFKCDIRKMFYQVLVQLKFRDYLRFWWWPQGKLDQPPKQYRMKVHLFGATSSPGCANFALKKTAEMYGGEFSEKVQEFINDNFYVDDGLGGGEDVRAAANLAKEAHQLCGKSGFDLVKFDSNDAEVLQSIPRELRAEHAKDLDLETSETPDRTLGVWTSLKEDKITFRVNKQEKPITRRGVLSTVGSVYDPLGLVAPYVLKGKKILQNVCQENKEWDAQLSSENERDWKHWVDQMEELEDIKLDRCFVDQDFEEPMSVQMHHFADASLDGHGCASYVRIKDAKGRVKVSLAMGKARVPPTKSTTIPRRELVAAVAAVKLARFLERELKFENVEHFFYSDSMIVLGYINNEWKRFHVFVANRVYVIRTLSDPKSWYHVDGTSNPADLASRGTSVQELKSNRLWFDGPEFLRDPDYQPKQKTFHLNEDDVEVRKPKNAEATVNATAAEPRSSLVALTERLSKWSRVTGVMMRIYGWIQKVKPDIAKDEVELKQKAMNGLLRAVQSSTFPKEKGFVSEDRRDMVRMRKLGFAGDTRLRKLDVFRDSQGTLRVGGRLKNADIPYEERHPIVVDKSAAVATLLVRHHHQSVRHGGREATLHELRRNGIWIVSPRSLIDGCLDKCVGCKKLRGKPQNPKMADLPEDRLKDEPPFTRTGVDFFGPYAVKVTRNVKVKKYGVMYTCLSSRAVYIDVAKDLSAEGFMASFRRFSSRRGPCRVLRCDRGTNFVAVRKNLEMRPEDFPEDDIRRSLLKENCQLLTMKLNPPSASHMGGVWERQIRSARNILNAIMAENSLLMEEDDLRTAFAEAEGIMNSRPLCAVDGSGAESVSPISPGMILTMKPKVAPPPNLQEQKGDNRYCIRRWNQVQAIADQFWYKWRKELLPQLQERRKWQKEGQPLKVDDIVLVMDENAPRMGWSCGRVTELMKGQDGRVRSVKVKTSKSEYLRPVHKLVPLVT